MLLAINRFNMGKTYAHSTARRKETEARITSLPYTHQTLEQNQGQKVEIALTRTPNFPASRQQQFMDNVEEEFLHRSWYLVSQRSRGRQSMSSWEETTLRRKVHFVYTGPDRLYQV